MAISDLFRNKKPHSEELITLTCPKTPLALGAPPRLSYPLVIFLTREFDSDDHLHPNETVSEIGCRPAACAVGGWIDGRTDKAQERFEGRRK